MEQHTDEELKILRTTGFDPLKPGMIHLRCPLCGQKVSNAPRYQDDMPETVLVEVLCAICAGNADELSCYYFDAEGNEVACG